MELAVYIPEQEPQVGQALLTYSSTPSSSSLPIYFCLTLVAAISAGHDEAVHVVLFGGGEHLFHGLVALPREVDLAAGEAEGMALRIEIHQSLGHVVRVEPVRIVHQEDASMKARGLHAKVPPQPERSAQQHQTDHRRKDGLGFVQMNP